MLPVYAVAGSEAARVVAFKACHDMAQLRNPLGRRNVYSGSKKDDGLD